MSALSLQTERLGDRRTMSALSLQTERLGDRRTMSALQPRTVLLGDRGQCLRALGRKRDALETTAVGRRCLAPNPTDGVVEEEQND
jgi:hypothetical protein